MKSFQCEIVLENDDDIEMEMSDDEYDNSAKKPRLEKSKKKVKKQFIKISQFSYQFSSTG